MVKKILSTALSCVMVFSFMSANIINASAAKSYSDKVSVARVWDGTYDIDWFTNDKDSYNIYTAEEFAGLMKVLNDDLQGNCMQNITVNLMNDIVLNDTSNFKNWEKEPPKNLWEPGGYSKGPILGYGPFAGILNGNGHTISGLYAKRSNNAGLFNYTCAAQILNLRMEKCYVESSWDGGVITAVAQGTIFKQVEIDNCVVKATASAGGLVGYANKFVHLKEFAVLGYFIGMGVTGIALNPLLFAGAAEDLNKPESTFFYACKVKNSIFEGTDAGSINSGALGGCTTTPIGIQYCFSENNTFGSDRAAVTFPERKVDEDSYLVLDTYSSNDKDVSGKKATLTDSDFVKRIKQSAVKKSSFVKKLNKKFFAYDKGNSPKIKSIIDTPVDVVLNGKKGTFSWEAVDGAVKYKVMYKNSDGKYATLSTTKKTTTTIKGIKKGKTYQILIRAYFEDGTYETVNSGKFKFKA